MSQHHPASPTLLVKAPQGGTRELEVSRTPFTIGRKHDNDLCREDLAVSAHHARIVQVQQVLFLEDLTSTNGTFVNEQKIDRRQLRDADSIRLGTHRLIFREAHPITAETAGTGEILITDDNGREREKHKVPYGATLKVVDGEAVKAGARLAAWDPHTRPMIGRAVQQECRDRSQTAAVINRRGEGYVVSQTESGKRILVNGRHIQGEHALRNGDVVEVAGLTMRFLLRDPKGSLVAG